MDGSYRLSGWHTKAGMSSTENDTEGDWDSETDFQRSRLKSLPEGVSPHERVLACTLFVPHNGCMTTRRGPVMTKNDNDEVADVEDGDKDGDDKESDDEEGNDGDKDGDDKESDEEEGNDGDKHGDNEEEGEEGDDDGDEGDDEEGAVESDVVDSVGVGKLRKRKGASLTTTQLFRHFQADYEREGRVWTQKELRSKVSKLDPGAVSICGGVMKKLRAVHEVNAKQSQYLTQGIAQALQKRGFGIALHMTDAEGIRSQIFAAAKKLYLARLNNPKVC